MPIAYQFGHTETLFYSQGVDLLLQWGFIHLLQNDDEPLQELEGKWEYLKATGASFEGGLEILEKETDSVLSFLHGPSTIDVDSAVCDQTMSALKTLDQIVFLADSLENFPDISRLTKTFQKRVKNLSRLVTVERPPLTLRLIPLNKWRQEALRYIPPHAHPLFPWYSSWTDLSPYFLDLLSERWDEAAAGKVENLGIDRNRLTVVLSALSQDQPLLARILKDIHVCQILPQAVEKNMVLRLMAIRDEEIAGRSFPDVVGKIGLINTACQAIGDPAHTETERIEQLFLAAFCGPFLDDYHRLSIFSDIELNLKNFRPGHLRPGSVLDTLWLWSKGSLSDEELARRVFQDWENRLIQIAEHTDAQRLFLNAVEKLSFSGKPAKGWGRFRGLIRTAYLKGIAGVVSLALVIALTLLGHWFWSAESDLMTPGPGVIKKKIHSKTASEPADLRGLSDAGDKLRLVEVTITPAGPRAVIEFEDGKQGVFRQGEDISDAVRVLEISTDGVVIEKTVTDAQGKKIRETRRLAFPPSD
jgi:hypothetical protein